MTRFGKTSHSARKDIDPDNTMVLEPILLSIAELWGVQMIRLYRQTCSIMTGIYISGHSYIPGDFLSGTYNNIIHTGMIATS